MKRFIILWPLVGLFVMYVMHKGYQEKQSALARLTYLENIIKFKNNELHRYQIINEKILTEKVKAENKSVELIKHLEHELKHNQCADEIVPVKIANKLYNRVYQIRKSAENISNTMY